MKSYTDIEQSKKLAEILPIESADMAWCNNSIKGINYTDEFSANLYTVKEMKNVFDEALVGWDKYWELIPCWSLAALLEYMNRNFYNISLNYCGSEYSISFDDSEKYKTITKDYSIDAVFEMVIWLKENNRL